MQHLMTGISDYFSVIQCITTSIIIISNGTTVASVKI